MNLANWPKKRRIPSWLLGMGMLLSAAVVQAAVIAQSTSELQVTLTSMTGSLLFSAGTPTVDTNESSTSGVATATNTYTFVPPNTLAPINIGDTLSVVASIQDVANGPGSQADSELVVKNGLFLFAGPTGATVEFSYLFTSAMTTVEDVPADVTYAEGGYDVQINGASQQGTSFSVQNGNSLNQSEQGTFSVTLYPYMATTVDVYAMALGSVKAYRQPVVPAPTAFWLLVPALAGFVWQRRRARSS